MQCTYLMTNSFLIEICLLNFTTNIGKQYHRVIKQVCHIEHFQVRSQTAIRNHIFASICSYVRLQYLRITDFIDNCYSLQRNLFNEVISTFIQNFIPSIKHLDSQIHKKITL